VAQALPKQHPRQVSPRRMLASTTRSTACRRPSIAGGDLLPDLTGWRSGGGGRI
jgi:hypothetical protein